MSIKNKICSDSWTRTPNKQDLSEVTLFVEMHIKVNFDLIYENDEYLYYGKLCDGSVFYKIHKSKCCNFYNEIEEGNFIDEIPVESGEYFDNYIFDEIILR